eukprot:6430014-Pyramimonas_sp.AAC.1
MNVLSGCAGCGQGGPRAAPVTLPSPPLAAHCADMPRCAWSGAPPRWSSAVELARGHLFNRLVGPRPLPVSSLPTGGSAVAPLLPRARFPARPGARRL